MLQKKPFDSVYENLHVSERLNKESIYRCYEYASEGRVH